LRKSGGALIVTVPKDYIRDNALAEGAQLSMVIEGSKMVLEPASPARRRRPTLAELLANTPEFDRVPGWDEMPAVGLEVSP
jgi:antitoxin MazE/antitoxin ChpS